MAAPHQKPEYTLQIRRTFAAPREKVFAAWARREQLEKWMCKDVASLGRTPLRFLPLLSSRKHGGKYFSWS
jgi:uncharacterized protein YndB with AHSA1/START domain